jgi:Xaa-Pro aminopeptidase
MGIGTRIAYNDVKIAAGHVLSNEPGYYEDGASLFFLSFFLS